jgi:hypothetical protein
MAEYVTRLELNAWLAEFDVGMPSEEESEPLEEWETAPDLNWDDVVRMAMMKLQEFSPKVSQEDREYFNMRTRAIILGKCRTGPTYGGLFEDSDHLSWPLS